MENSFKQLALIAMADGRIDKKEKTMLMEWGKGNGLDNATMKTLFEQVKQRQGVGEKATKSDLELMVCMALVDGSLSQKELRVLNNMANKIGLTSLDVRKMIAEFQS